MKFNNIKIEKYPPNIIFYRISFFQENDDLLNHFFSQISYELKIIAEKLHLFYLSDHKEIFENAQFYSIWDDHPYPDEIVICWSGLDTTKNNLGRVITICPSDDNNAPYLLYSFTKGRLYIVENFPRWDKEEGIPSIIEFTIPEFLKILEIIGKNIDKMNELVLDECEIESFEI